MSTVNVRELQAPLAARYREDPRAARVVDTAVTSSARPDDPFHFNVEPMRGSGSIVQVGVHDALGGPHDAPTPGDLLCAALAACQESSIRMIANALRINLTHVKVTVEGEVDVRGTMMVDPTVPVGFQVMRVTADVRAAEGTPARMLETLSRHAEASCVVLQTLRTSPEVDVDIRWGDFHEHAA